MIYTRAGVPLTEALPLARIAYAEWVQRHARRVPNYVLTDGQREHKVGRDKNGDVFPVYREVHSHRPGRGFEARQQTKLDRGHVLRPVYYTAG